MWGKARVNMKLEELEIERKKINNEWTELRNRQYNIDKEYQELLQEKCKENIGRCFKKLRGERIIAYCIIIGIDKPKSQMNGLPLFNEYQYPAIWFKYPYKGSKMPFYEDEIFSGAWGKGNNFVDKLNDVSYKEITKEEFLSKFNEVNQVWVKRLVEI